MAERHSWPGIIFVNISSYIQENTMNGGGSRRCFQLSVPQKIPSFCPVFHFLVKLGWVWTEWVIYTIIHIYCFDFDAVGLSLATTYMHSPKTGKWGWQGRLGLGNIYIISNYVPCDLITDAWMRSKLPWPSF